MIAIEHSFVFLPGCGISVRMDLTEKCIYIRSYLDRPVLFMGLMAAGKSRIGKLLADALDIPFTDCDHVIEETAGLSITEIFEMEGEDAFRRMERTALENLLKGGIRVISTGGGAVVQAGIMDMVKAGSVSVWIRADMALHLERTAGKTNRPLLQNGNPEAVFQDLMERRYPVYAQADIVVDSCSGPHEKTLRRVVDSLYDFLKDKEGNAGH